MSISLKGGQINLIGCLLFSDGTIFGVSFWNKFIIELLQDVAIQFQEDRSSSDVNGNFVYFKKQDEGATFVLSLCDIRV